MPSLAGSIQKLLQLSSPLPSSITEDLRVGNSLLLQADEDFKAIAHDLRVWTLYETIDSRLTGGGESNTKDGNKNNNSVYFTAPLASIKSAILGMRQERIFPLQSDHANVASFGRHNTHTLRLFLRQLAGLINRADASVKDDESEGARWTLGLDQRVNVEIHGFFEDGVDEPITRAWSTRLPLKEFLKKGPEVCLSERLNEVEGVPDEGQFLRSRGRTMSLTEAENDRVRREASARDGLGIKNQLIQQGSPPISPIIRPVDVSPRSAPEIIPSVHTHQQIRRISSPPLPTTAHRISTPTRYSTPIRRPSPLIRPDFEQDLAIDRLSPPIRPRSIMSFGRSVSDQSSQYEYRDFPPFSQHRSRSTIDDGAAGQDIEDDDIEASPPLPEALIPLRKLDKHTKARQNEAIVVDDGPVAFSRPDVSQRKFLWVHLPYNNPTWVKVSWTLTHKAGIFD